MIWAGNWEKDPGDAEILARGLAEGRVVITLDKDFGELAIVRGQKHRGIIRLVGLSVTRQALASLGALESYAAELAHGALVTVEAFRVRVRPPA